MEITEKLSSLLILRTKYCYPTIQIKCLFQPFRRMLYLFLFDLGAEVSLLGCSFETLRASAFSRCS